MEKINCNVIQDILPLYIDDVVSDDTKELVEEHLQNCEICQRIVYIVIRMILARQFTVCALDVIITCLRCYTEHFIGIHVCPFLRSSGRCRSVPVGLRSAYQEK